MCVGGGWFAAKQERIYWLQQSTFRTVKQGRASIEESQESLGWAALAPWEVGGKAPCRQAQGVSRDELPLPTASLGASLRGAS